MFLSKCEIFALQIAYAWVAELFPSGGNQCTPKTVEHYCDLNWQLWCHKHWTMTSLTFVGMFKQFYSKFDMPSTTPTYTTPYLSYPTLCW